MAKRPWRWIGIGVALLMGWAIAGSALFGDARLEGVTAAITVVPFLLAAGLVLVAAVGGARDKGRRAERPAFALAAAAGGLLTAGIGWGLANELRGSEDTVYVALLIVALLLLPVAGALGFSARRFARRPEAVREPLARRLARGWGEATRSWIVLVGSGRLLLLPAASWALGVATWIGGYLLAGQWVDSTMGRLVLAGFLLLLPGTVLGTFFGVAYLAALDRRLSDEPATVRDGLRVAWRRRGAILGWSVLAAGVGALIQGLQQLRSEWAVAPLLSWLAGAAWGVLTLFVLPVIAIEDVGVRDAVRRAGGLVKQRWGEGMAGAGNLTLVAGAAGAAVAVLLAPAFVIAAPDRDAIQIVFLASLAVFVAIIAVIGTAMQVLSLALYRHATGGGAIGPFTADDLQHAIIERRRLHRRPS
jgi:hypothetical protein